MAEETVFRMDVDTSEAQRKVDELDDSTKSLHDHLENIGGAGKSFGDGITTGAGDGMLALDKLGGAASAAGSAVSSFGDAGAAAGSRIRGAMDNAADSSIHLDATFDEAQAGAGNLAKVGEDTGGRIRNAFENAATASDSMGTSFAKNFTRASEAGKSFSSSVKTGVTGVFDTAKRRVTSFAKDSVDNVKKVGNAFLHPIQTIKGKFSGAMKDAAKDTGDVGDKAEKSGKDLDDMGKSGASAGDKLQKGLGSALKVIAAIAAAAAMVTGIAKFTTAALDASKAAENISYSFDKTFGDSAPDVEGWADNFSKAVHRSGSEVKSFLTSNKQLYEGLGITGQAANDLSKLTTSLAFDIGNKFGVDDAEALSKLQDAITGNDKALSEFGVKLDAAALKQSAMKMGLSGNLDALDEATLAQVRFNAIMEQTGDIQQNASKSIGGFTGGVKALKAGWTDFLEKAGTKLAPTFDKIFGVILAAWPKVEPALMSFVDLLAGGFEQAAPMIADFATNLLPQLLGLAGELLPVLMDIGGELLPVIAQVLGTVVGAIGPLMPLIGTLVKTLLPPLAQLFGTLVETLLPPLANLLGAFSPIISALSPVLEIVAGAIGLVANAIAGLIGWLTKGIEKIGEFASGLKDTAVGKFVSGIGDGIKNAANSVKGVFGGNAKGTDNFEGGWTRINEAGGEMIQAKHGEGVAYLPRGSAVIPASKTEEILSGSKSVGGKVINITAQLQLPESRRQPGDGIVDNPRVAPQPDPNWTPVVLKGNPNINYTPDEPEPDGGDPRGGDPKDNPPPPPPPAPGGEAIPHKVIDLNINISSSDGSVAPEVLERIKREVLTAVKEEQNSEYDNLAIQRGYAG